MKGIVKMRKEDQDRRFNIYRIFRTIKAILLVFALVASTNWLSQRHFLIEQEPTGFGNAKFTSIASLCHIDLKKEDSELWALEKLILQDNHENLEQARLKIKACFDHIMVNLDSNANVNFRECAQLSVTKSKSLHASKLLMNVEMAFLIIVGVIIQLIIYYPWKP